MEVYLIRHTQVGVPKSICYGQTDVPLADSFATDKEAVLAQLPPLHTLTVYSSPARRCTQLAACISASYQVHRHLQEVHFGDWEGQHWDAISPTELEPWMHDFVSVCPPGGESFQQLYARSTHVFHSLCRIHDPDSRLVLVTHAGVIRSLLCHVHQVSLREAFGFTVDYGMVIRLTL